MIKRDRDAGSYVLTPREGFAVDNPANTLSSLKTIVIWTLKSKITIAMFVLHCESWEAELVGWVKGNGKSARSSLDGAPWSGESSSVLHHHLVLRT